MSEHVMSHQLSDLLNAWQAERDSTDWVLGTVYRTEGSAYRKAGAMMLIDGYGRHFGLLSGGCLEADILRHARKVMASGQVELLVYDGSDEDDWSYQLGIGCGGKIFIMLQPLTPGNDLGLSAMAAALSERRPGIYCQKIGAARAEFLPSEKALPVRSVVETRSDGDWLVTPIRPEPHLLVVGGGIDARPVVRIAAELGWQVTLADPRNSHARPAYFPDAKHLLRHVDASLTHYIGSQRVDAAVIMSHNVEIDARALAACQGTDLAYLALLGPRHRFRRVLEAAGLSESALTLAVSAPAGLDIGGQLPESIALSILAECHAVLYQSQSLPALSVASN